MSAEGARTVDLPDDPVAVGVATTDLSRLDTAPNAAMGLGAKVFEEQRVHRALEPDMQLRHFALGQGDNRDPREPQAFEEPGYVFLIAAEPVERFGENQIELSGQGVAHRCLCGRGQRPSRSEEHPPRRRRRGVGGCAGRRLIPSPPAKLQRKRLRRLASPDNL
jgi:hypothetical protein